MKIYPIITQNSLRNIFYIIEYGYLQAIVIDPSNSEIAKKYLKKYNLTLEKIFITHEHYDHYEGVSGLGCQEVYAGEIAAKNMPIEVKYVFQDEEVFFECENFSLRAIYAPGHAAGHMMFELSEGGITTAIFSGDVLFQGGVGHTRNGSNEDLYNSVAKFEKYSDEIIIYSGHDYLQNNAKFIEKYCPENTEKLQEILNLSQTKEMFFTNLLQERSINPFVGVSLEEFTRLRNLRNNF